MSRKLIQIVGDVNHCAAKVYRDSEWNEYRVRFITSNRVNPDADYHTDDKQDALDTARVQTIRSIKALLDALTPGISDWKITPLRNLLETLEKQPECELIAN